MSLCAVCCADTLETEICPHHERLFGDAWADSNRVMCDFFHRGVIPERVTEDHDEFWHAGVG